MAKKSGLAQEMYVAGYDISGDVGSVSSMAVTSNSQDVTGLNQSAHQRIGTLHDASIAFDTFFNDASNALHDALKGLPTTDVGAMYLTGTTRGDGAFCMEAKQIDYNWTRGADGSLTGTTEARSSSGGANWCRLLVKKVTHSSATDETGIVAPGGAQTTKGAVGYLQHMSAGSGTVEYDIEDSSDSTNGSDGAWANLLAFADVATPWNPITGRVQVTGNVEKWVRASTNGTFTNAVFAMAFYRGLDNDDLDLS